MITLLPPLPMTTGCHTALFVSAAVPGDVVSPHVGSPITSTW